MFSFIFSTERFCAFDYGDGNQDIYGQETPPDYDLTKVTAPVALYWGDNDWLAQQTVNSIILCIIKIFQQALLFSVRLVRY